MSLSTKAAVLLHSKPQMNIVYLNSADPQGLEQAPADLIVHSSAHLLNAAAIVAIREKLAPRGVYVAMVDAIFVGGIGNIRQVIEAEFAFVQMYEWPADSGNNSVTEFARGALFLAAAAAENCDIADVLFHLAADGGRAHTAAKKLAEQATEAQNRTLKMERCAVWRMTRPFRKISALDRNARAVWRMIQDSLIKRGGWKETLIAIGSVFKTTGLRGVVRKVGLAPNIVSNNPRSSATYVYEDWISKYDAFDDAKREALKFQLGALEQRPCISILVPTFNTPRLFLIEMIESVRNQIYENWELCIADDCSTQPDVREILQQYASKDHRIKLHFRATNGHICAASNSALALATSDFVGLLDHDDLLAPHALFMIAKYLTRYPVAELLYSDEDKWSPQGRRAEPYFKPDWNPELIRTQNFFGHFGIYRTELVRRVGGFREGFEGSQDHDLILRCSEEVDPSSIIHIPHVLYHWRSSAGSTARSAAGKPYAEAAAFKAIDEHLVRRGLNASVGLDDYGFRRIQYRLADSAPLVSIIIPTRDGLALLKQCIDSIVSKSSYKNFEIIVIDNGSSDVATINYLEHLNQDGVARVIRDASPFNYSALNNRGVECSRGEYICLLNNDVEVITPNWLGEMVALAAQPGNGCVGARLWYPNQKLQHGGVLLGLGGVAGHSHLGLPRGEKGYFSRGVLNQNFSSVTAACLLVSASIYREVHGLDEDLAVAFNDVDFCLRVRYAGYRNIWAASVEMYHYESATRGSDIDGEKRLRFLREYNFMQQRWGNWLQEDPAYNPNLDLNFSGPTFLYADPPRISQFG